MNHKLQLVLRNFWPISLWAIFIFILSALPADQFPEIPSFLDWLGPDKMVHLIFYGLFGFLLMLGLERQYKPAGKRLSFILITFLGGTIFGALLEVLQFYVFICRSGNVYDAIASSAGTIIGIAGFDLFHRKKINNTDKKQ